MDFTDFIFNSINKIINIGAKTVGKNTLTNCNWYLISDSLENEILYIFEQNNTLLISTNGIISRHNKYKFIIDNDNILINYRNKNTEILYTLTFLRNDFILLEQKPGKLLVFVNKTKYKDILKLDAREILRNYNKS